MEVIDYSKKFDVSTTKCESHAAIFPKNIFCVIAGATGSGKTNLMVNLLLQESTINYADVHIYSKTLFQPAYEFLKSRYKMFEKLIKNKTNKTVKLAYFYKNDDVMVDSASLNKDQNHIMVFDDVLLEAQATIKRTFVQGGIIM